MDVTFPDRYYRAVDFVEKQYGDIENNVELDTAQKLVFYALRQQVDHGPCTAPAPYMWNVKEKYKHAAWSQLKSMSKYEAMVHYVRQLEEIRGPSWITSTAGAACSELDTSAHDEDVSDGLSTEVSESNVKFLIAEVTRLRTILRTRNISFKEEQQQPAGGSAELPQSNSSNNLQDTLHVPPPPSGPSPPEKPVNLSIQPPVKPLPVPSSTSSVSLLNDSNVSVTDEEEVDGDSTNKRRIGWLEWLGF